MKTYKSESNVKPSSLDINVDTVYHNYNIVEKTKEDEQGTTTYYEYDVDEYTLQEYTTTQVARNSQSIDDIVISMLGE